MVKEGPTSGARNAKELALAEKVRLRWIPHQNQKRTILNDLAVAPSYAKKAKPITACPAREVDFVQMREPAA